MTDAAKTIFILGAGVMQLPAIRAAKSMGWRVIVADGSAAAEGVPLADRFVHVDLKDRAAMAAAVAEARRDGGVDGVFTAGTDFSATVAWAAAENGLPGISYETALKATDKIRMRRAFREHGVPQPDFMELAASDDPATVLEKLSFPLVVKPVDNMGARGVRRIDTREELAAACRTAFEFSRSGRVIAEEYVAGPEYSLDALVSQGRPTLCGIADRHIFFEPYFVEMGHTMPALLDSATLDRITSVFFAGIRALGIDNGAAKGDIKLSANGPLVGEIAARLSGGYMSGWTFPYASGVDVTRSALRIAVGLTPLDLTPASQAWSAERAFISLPGRVAHVSGIEELRGLPGVKDVFVRAKEGAPVEFPKNNVQKCGNVITRGMTRAEAIESAVGALARIFIRLVPAQSETDSFLFRESHPVSGAIRLTLPENLAALERLPGWQGDPAAFDPRQPLALDLPRRSEEPGPDWHGLTLDRACGIAAGATGLRFSKEPEAASFALGSIFWKAFLRGGAQAAVYLLDTLASKAGSRADFSAYLKAAG